VSQFRTGMFAAFLASATALAPASAFAETISGALAKAYQLNSTLNSARAGVRVVDEDVAIAKSGYRPTITGSGAIDYSNTHSRPEFGHRTTELTTGSFGVEIRQTLFDGFQTKNNVGAAESRVRAQQQSLRNDEQLILFDAASAYMDVIRDRQIAVLRERNLQFLSEQVRAARSRFDVGEGTRTDVAQADASRSAAVAQLAAARAQAKSSEAVYQRLVGEAPGSLKAASPLVKLLPKSLDQAVGLAREQHPAIVATEHLVDAAGFSVRSAEGALLPQVSASAGVSEMYRDSSPDTTGLNGRSTSAGVGLQLTVPIYQGGRASAQVRKSKETLGQARIEVDVSRDQVRAAVTSAWSQYMASQENISAIRDTVSAAQLALEGVIEERNVGQRTTLDVLDSQADVIDAQIALVEAERNVVVASYAILSAVGNLSARRLALQVTEYRPEEHYNAVKDKWYGLRTPDGR
jgi:outer membrane protein